jgi:hypothetical protein
MLSGKRRANASGQLLCFLSVYGFRYHLRASFLLPTAFTTPPSLSLPDTPHLSRCLSFPSSSTLFYSLYFLLPTIAEAADARV